MTALRERAGQAAFILLSLLAASVWVNAIWHGVDWQHGAPRGGAWMPAEIRAFSPELLKIRPEAAEYFEGGDQILSVNGRPLRGASDWHRAFVEAGLGDKVRVVFRRAGAPPREVMVSVQAEDFGWLYVGGCLSMIWFLPYQLVRVWRSSNSMRERLPGALAWAAFSLFLSMTMIRWDSMHWALAVPCAAVSCLFPYVAAQAFARQSGWIHWTGLALSVALAGLWFTSAIWPYQTSLPVTHVLEVLFATVRHLANLAFWFLVLFQDKKAFERWAEPAATPFAL